MSTAAIKTAFVTAVQEILAEAELLVKEVDGVWDSITQDAYRAFATKHGHDAVQVTHVQPTKIEQLPAAIQQVVADKVAAVTQNADTEKTVAHEQAATPVIEEVATGTVEQTAEKPAASETDGTPPTETPDNTSTPETGDKAPEQSGESTDKAPEQPPVEGAQQ